MARKSNPYKQPDHFTREAKKAGYPARSVFKLEEIDRREPPLQSGNARARSRRVAGELVALRRRSASAPSGRCWRSTSTPLGTRAAAERDVPPGGRLRDRRRRNRGVRAVRRRPLRHGAATRPATGSATRARSFELFMRALDVAATLSVPGGAFVGKIFMGEDLRHGARRGCGAVRRRSASFARKGRAA